MKSQKKHMPSIGMALALCALLLTLAGCAPSFDGSDTKNAGAYALDVRSMTGTDLHTMELSKGDVLQIRFETEKGSLYLEITAPDGTTIYGGNGTEAAEFTLNVPLDGLYILSVEGKRARGSIRVEAEEKSGPEAAQGVTAEELAGPWHLAEGENDESAVNRTFPGAMEFGSGMEITGDGQISWYIGAEGGSGTYTLDGNILSAGMTDDFDGTDMNIELTAEKDGGRLLLAMDRRGLTLYWARGGRETGKGGEP